MEKEELKKRCSEWDVVLTPNDLLRWAEYYRSHLIDELYAVEKAIVALSWISSEEEYALQLDRDTVLKTLEMLMRAITFRHMSTAIVDGDYNVLIKKTDDDFFGGIHLRDLACTLEILASLMRDDQGQQG